jgi:hypothetical protein
MDCEVFLKGCLPVPNTRYLLLQSDTLERKTVVMNLTAHQQLLELLDLFGRQILVRSRDLEPSADSAEDPVLLDHPAPHLRVYHRETLIAETFQVMVSKNIVQVSEK